MIRPALCVLVFLLLALPVSAQQVVSLSLDVQPIPPEAETVVLYPEADAAVAWGCYNCPFGLNPCLFISSGYEGSSLLRFDLLPLRGKQTLRAVLRLYVMGRIGWGVERIALYSVSGPWDEERVTYGHPYGRENPRGTAWFPPDWEEVGYYRNPAAPWAWGSIDMGTGWWSMDITPFTSSRDGFYLAMPSLETSGVTYIISSREGPEAQRPQLVVTYVYAGGEN